MGLVAVVLAATFSSCSASPSGSTGTTRPTDSTSTTTVAPTTSAPASFAGDAALAKSELLPSSAYPSGWQGQGAGSATSRATFFGGYSSPDLAQLAACLGIRIESIHIAPAEADDQEYDDPSSSLTVTDSVAVYPVVTWATTDVQAAASPRAPACLDQVGASRITKDVPSGMTVATPSFSSVPIPSYGDRDAAVMLTFDFTYQGQSGTMHMEFVAVQRGRSEGVLEITDAPQVPPSTTVDQLASAVAAALHA